MKLRLIKGFYKSLQVDGRTHQCPRQGIYKILSTYQGISCNKQALMARCNWRATVADSYIEDFVVTVQLESFKRNADEAQLQLLNSEDLIGKQINVALAEYDLENKQFTIKWTFINERQEMLDKLNSGLRSGEFTDFEFDDSVDGIDTANDEQLDY